MKYKNKFWEKNLLAIFYLAAGFLIINSTSCKDLFNKKPVVTIKQAIKAPVGIAFIDGDFAAAKNVPEVKVTIIDSLGKVLSSNGIPFKEITVTGGVMSVGLDESADISVENPYRFFVRAEASGYMTAIRPVVITEDAPNYVPIYMAALDDLPSTGLAASVGNIAAISVGKLQETQFLSARTENGLPLTIQMTAGTQMLYDGKPVETNGTLSYRLLLGVARDSNANRVFPGGFEATDAVDANGNILASPSDPLFFTTAGWFSMEMNIEKQEVNGFSQPLIVDMPIADSIVNPLTNQFVIAGDTIPLWSLNNRTGVWTQDSFTVVMNEGGKLKARFQVSHLSDWNVDYQGGQCANNCTVSFNGFTPIANKQYWTRFVKRSDGTEIKAKLNVFSNFSNPFQLIMFPADASVANPYKLLIHDGTNTSYPVIRISDDIVCAPNASVNLNLFGTGGTCAEIEFKIGADNIKPCNNSLWIKNINASLYEFAGVLQGSGVANPSGVGVIQNLSNLKQVRLWYINKQNNQDEQVTIDMKINFGINVSGSDPTAMITINNGDPTTYSIPYTKSSSATCNYKMTVTLPNIAFNISGGVCNLPS